MAVLALEYRAEAASSFESLCTKPLALLSYMSCDCACGMEPPYSILLWLSIYAYSSTTNTQAFVPETAECQHAWMDRACRWFDITAFLACTPISISCNFSPLSLCQPSPSLGPM